MKLPRYTATTPPPRETGLVRAQNIGALTNTGDAEFEALTHLGGAMKSAAGMGYQAYMQRQEIDDIIESGDVNQKDKEIWSKAFEAAASYNPSFDEVLPDDPEYLKKTTASILSAETIKKYRSELLSDVQKDSAVLYANIKSPRTKALLIRDRNERVADNIELLDKMLNRTLHKYQVKKVTDFARTAAANGDIELANYWTDIGTKHGLWDDVAAKELKKENTKDYITGLYRMGAHDEARKVLEASDLGSKEKEMLDDEIDVDERAKTVEFENSINDELVRIDNTPDMTQADFNEQARKLKDVIVAADLPGTQKKKMLSDLENWRRGTNEIDYAKILSLNQEMDAAQRSGIVDPTIRDRIMRASLEGSFGGRNKGGQKTYGDMIRRFEKLAFDERMQSIEFVVRSFEKDNSDDPRIIFLFHQAKNKFIAENPDIDAKELFIKISGMAESYSVLPESTIQKKMGNQTITMTSPDGKQYKVPIEKRQTFLDNGYTE